MPIRPENRDRYPKDWATRSRFVRHYRARNRCEWCGVANGTPLPMRCCSEPAITDGDTTRCASCRKRVPCVVLTVAHVHDHRPEAAGLLNLASLCQKCHLRHDAKMHARNAAETRRRRRERGQLLMFD